MTEHPTALQIVEGIDLSGKTCVITGASSGLGRESARALAAGGAHVILAARNPEALAETARWIASEVPAARTSTVSLDLTDLSSVRAA
ncbi:SDR family NAD(P)-dependent oxidoreductase, partial [Mycobacterium paraintracellulare]